jgi:hypothetical protein
VSAAVFAFVDEILGLELPAVNISGAAMERQWQQQ